MSNIFFPLFSIMCLISCSNNHLGPAGSGIEGVWRLYEYGGSPGYGYYVVAVPGQPLQSLTFNKKGAVNTQGDQLNGVFAFPFYRVVTVQDELKIEFLADKKQESAVNYMRLEIVGDTMHIRPTCFEGCHYSFVRIR